MLRLVFVRRAVTRDRELITLAAFELHTVEASPSAIESGKLYPVNRNCLEVVLLEPAGFMLAGFFLFSLPTCYSAHLPCSFR
jgi:hypothetical protein